VSKTRMLFAALAMAMMVFSNTAIAGMEKTADALKGTIATIEKADVPNNPALTEALERARDLSKNYWKLTKTQVYKKAAVIYDDLRSALKGTSLDIIKPSWL
jgi:hypothetical protein